MSNIRRHLFVLLTLVFVIGLTAQAASSANAVKEEALDARVKEREAVASALAGLYTATVVSLEQMVTQWSLAPGWQLTGADPADSQRLDVFARHPDGQSAAVLTLDGRVLARNTGGGTVPPLTDPGWEPLLGGVAAGGAGYSGRLEVDGTPVSAIAWPMAAPDGSTAVLVVFFRATDNKPLAQLAAARTDQVRFVAPDQSVVLSGQAEDVARLPEVAPLLGKAPQTVELVVQGVDSVAVAAPLGTSGWSLVHTQSAAEFYGNLRNRSRQGQVQTALALGVAVLALLFFGLQRERALRRGEALVTAMLQNAVDIVALVRNGRIAFAGGATDEVLGRRPRSLVGAPPTELVKPEDAAVVDDLVHRAVGTPGDAVQGEVRLATTPERWAEVTAVNLAGNRSVGGVIVTFHDVTERRRMNEQLAFRATHDVLTGLSNRALFTTRLEQSMARARRHDGSLAVLFLDLDDFKPVNDRLGHEAGDQLLRGVADRLVASVRTEDTVARFGGDEFAVIVEDAADEESARQAAQRLVDSLTQPFDIDGEAVHVGVSVGVAYATPRQETTESLLRQADLAMYQAKRRGRSQVQLTSVA